MKLFYSYMGRSRSYILSLWNVNKGKINKVFWPATHGHFALVMPGRHFLTILCFMLFGAGVARSQSPDRETVDNDNITPLNIGDPIPDALWNMPLQVVNHPDGKETITLGEYRDKLIILDFWATWCSPCISSLHKLDTLQKKYTGEVVVLPSSYEGKDKINPVIERYDWSLPSIVSEETRLKQYFPHNTLPHQVWIKENKVRAIVKQKDATPENIEKMLTIDDFNIQTKNDVLDFDASKNISEYAIGSSILSTSTFTSHIEGLPASARTINANGKTVVIYTNANPMLMYASVLEARNNRILVQGRNLNKAENLSSKVKKKYCYQLIVPDTVEGKKINNRVLADLNSQFDLQVDTQIMEVECYVISKSLLKSKATIAKTETKQSTINHEFSDLIDLLNFSVRWTSDQPIFIDKSNYSGKIEAEQYKVLQKDIGKLTQALLPHGLSVTKEKLPIKMYIIRDAHEM